MRIVSLDLENWMNIDKAHLDFNDGINVLFGKNGQGKSAVFSAIAYLLLDKTRDTTYKSFIQSGKRFFRLKMNIDMGNNSIMNFSYEGKESSSQKEVSYQGITYSGENANNFIKSKFDQSILENVIFLLQDSPSVTMMTPSERRDIFKKLFNSDFSDITQRIKEDQKVISQKIDQENALIKVLQEKRYKFHRMYEVDTSTLSVLSEELLRSKEFQFFKEKLAFFKGREKELSRKKIELENNEISQKKVLTQIESLKEKIKTQQSTLEINTSSKESSLKEEISTIKSNLQSAENERSLFQFNEKKATLKKVHEEKTSLQISIRSSIVIISKHLEAHRKGICPECGQACSPLNMEKYEKELEKYKSDLQKIESNILIIKREMNELQTEKERIDSNFQNSSVLLTQKEGALSVLYSSIESITQSITSLNETISRYFGEVSQLQVNKKLLEKEVSELEDWLISNPVEGVPIVPREVSIIQKEIDNINYQVQDNLVKEQMNNITKEEQEKDQVRIKELLQTVEVLGKEFSNLGTLINIFSTDFPSFINMKACQILENYMNNFFKDTKEGFKISLQQDKKGINFFYKAGGELEWNPIRMASGFESDLFSLCFRIAVANAFGASFVVLDEPDGAGDEEHSSKLFSTIINIGGFKQMFIITHKESALDLLKENGVNGYYVQGGIFNNIY